MDWSLPSDTVESKQRMPVYSRGKEYRLLRILSKKGALNYLRWVERQQRHVFCFFTRAPFISAGIIRPGFDTSISVQCLAQPVPFFAFRPFSFSSSSCIFPLPLLLSLLLPLLLLLPLHPRYCLTRRFLNASQRLLDSANRENTVTNITVIFIQLLLCVSPF